MTTRKRMPPGKTLLGRWIMFWRTLKALVSPPSSTGILFGLKGQTLLGQKVLTLDANPDRVWRAIWQDIVLDPPHRTIDEIRDGETAGFYMDLTHGRGLYWCHFAILNEQAIPGRFARHRLVAIDGAADARVGAMTSEYAVEPQDGGTRLTIRVADDQAGEADVFRNFMAFAIQNDVRRILANLPEPKRPSPSGSGGSVPAVPRRSAMTRA
jgi:hypothetical protein